MEEGWKEEREGRKGRKEEWREGTVKTHEGQFDPGRQHKG